MMKNKKLILAVVALVAVIAVMAGVYMAARPETVEGAKTITVTVVHKDGTEKEFVCHTDEEYLGAVLVAEEIVVGEQGEFGLYFNTADGETADYSVDGGWWQVFVGEEAAIVGADSIVIADGDTFRLVYTIGSERHFDPAGCGAVWRIGGADLCSAGGHGPPAQH